MTIHRAFALAALAAVAGACKGGDGASAPSAPPAAKPAAAPATTKPTVEDVRRYMAMYNEHRLTIKAAMKSPKDLGNIGALADVGRKTQELVRRYGFTPAQLDQLDKLFSTVEAARAGWRAMHGAEMLAEMQKQAAQPPPPPLPANATPAMKQQHEMAEQILKNAERLRADSLRNLTRARDYADAREQFGDAAVDEVLEDAGPLLDDPVPPPR